MKTVVAAFAGLALIACGHSAPGKTDAGSDAADAAFTGDVALGHLELAPGWSVQVLADITGVVPYNPSDFMNGSNETLDNAPIAIAALYPPFTSSLAVSCGRSIIELAGDGTPTVHDYRPATPDTTGPDNIAALTFGDTSDVGPALWMAAVSQGNGDGLFRVDDMWNLTTDNADNNVTGVAYDPDGAFDNVGVPTIYFLAGDFGLLRRNSAVTNTSVFVEVPANSFFLLQLSASEIFTQHDSTTGSVGSEDLVGVLASTHASVTIDNASNMIVAEGGASNSPATVVRAGSALVRYPDSGGPLVIAQSIDPDWTLVAASLPRAPHALAGDIVVIESNRTLDRDDVLLFTPL